MRKPQLPAAVRERQAPRFTPRQPFAPDGLRRPGCNDLVNATRQGCAVTGSVKAAFDLEKAGGGRGKGDSRVSGCDLRWLGPGRAGQSGFVQHRRLLDCIEGEARWRGK